jgi:hypothetical protein
MRFLALSTALILVASPGLAQQRPLTTEDPETVGAGRLLVEGGLDFLNDQFYPVSGLKGNLLRLPTFGVSVGLGSIVELQIDGGYSRLTIEQRRTAPLSDAVDVEGDTTSSFEDLTVATKIRLAGETQARPAFGVRLATKLPIAGNESGLGIDTMDFAASLLIAKTVQSLRIVGNFGVAILGDPTSATDQNDLLIYGVSFARAFTDRTEFIGEINARTDTRSGPPKPGTESRATMRLGMRFTSGTVRLDAAVLIGMTSRDAPFGLSGGVTYVFNAFRVP